MYCTPQQQKLQKTLSGFDIQAAYITNPTNIFYLTGFKGVSETEREATLLVTAESLTLFVPAMYYEQARVLGGKDLSIVPLSKKGQMLVEIKKIVRTGAIGVEAAHLTVGEWQKLSQNLGSKYKLEVIEEIVEPIRVIKADIEIDYLRTAQDLSIDLLQSAIAKIKNYKSEREIYNYIKHEAEHRAHGLSFDPIVAFASNSALPHYRTGDTPLGEGILLVDIGLKYKHYHGDLTRTFYLGEPTKLFIQRYQRLLSAQEAVIAMIGPGVRASSLYESVLTELGSEAKFFNGIHSLGHGVGLNIHELPHLSSRTDEELMAGMILTIEPGLYYPGWGGMRIEDVVLVTDTGYELLSDSPKSSSEIIIS